ncbi:MAG TPA: S9 family peptidase, partial [Rhodothermales bacterium]|nr:S9 family peptidase [Rhodothermales bacterium]
MRVSSIALLVLASLLYVGCETNQAVDTPPLASTTSAEPPMAKIQRTDVPGPRTRTDDYYWLRERENPEVIAYLEAENAYTEAEMAHLKDLEDALFAEIKGRIKEDDASVPYKEGDYFYYTRYEEGKEYPIYARKKGSLDAEEQIMLDANVLAEDHEYFAVRGREISANQNILAYSVDTVGRRIYTLQFKNLTTGEVLADEIPDVTGNVAWANDNQTIFYTKQDPTTLRWYQIYRHVLGTDPAKDELVYEEDDDTFSSFVFRTKSKRYILIGSQQTLSSEYRYLSADDPAGSFQIIQPREDNHEYNVDHYGDHFYIRTNDSAQNFRLVKTPVTATEKANWEEVIPHRTDVLLENFEMFKDYLVLSERQDGLIRLRVRPWDGSGEHYIDFGEPAYLAYVETNPEFDTPVLRYGYTSMTTPNSVYDYHMATQEKTLMKQDEVLGDFDSSRYTTERLYATARDGVKVPISLVYRTDLFEQNGTAPLLLYGYGSYGYSLDATFSSARLSLLDRGFVYAIAHIRGGQEMGRQWYEDGKLLKKKNTFTDFIDSGEYLIAAQYADPERLFAMGGSAGGLLMGAVINMRPDLFSGVVAAVPFVDVVTTMLDDSIPLTTSEYDEWGDPNDSTYYDYMLSYSPYDNVEAKDYPNLLVTTGLHDSQVQYWEPAKWVARLRAMKTDQNRLLLKTNMDAGHGGASGRYKRYRETAFQYAFLLDLAGIQNITPT